MMGDVRQVIESEMTSQESGAKIDGVEVAQVNEKRSRGEDKRD